MSTSYREISGENGKLARLEPFVGNSMSATGNADGTGYSIYSYGTEIARVVRDPDSYRFVAYVSTRKYSPTTSRQQNYCRTCLPGELVDVPGPNRGGTLDTEPVA